MSVDKRDGKLVITLAAYPEFDIILDEKIIPQLVDILTEYKN